MPLPVPQLDDRRFQSIVDEAKRRLRDLCPAWTDHNVSDPGVTLIELFAWMTEMIIYRLNRVPEKQYITLLQLLGVTLKPPQPAQAQITFQLAQPIGSTTANPPFVPAGTEVATQPTLQRPEAVTFIVDADTPIVHPGPPRIYQKRENTLTASEWQNGGSPLLMFGDAQADPADGDSVYLGFDQPIAGLTLRLAFDFAGPGASNHNQQHPPIAWQAWCGPDGWVAASMHDTTGGLSNDGTIDLRVPLQMTNQPDLPGELAGAAQGYYLRCRYTPASAGQPTSNPGGSENRYKPAPTLRRLGVQVAGVTAHASHATLVIGELLGISSGMPNQRFRLAYSPALPFRPDEQIEVELDSSTPGGAFWQPWELAPNNNFSTSEGQNHVVVDFASGEVSFGPSIRAMDGTASQYGNIPPRGARIRVSQYRSGGGVAGNLPAGSLSVLKRTLPQIAPTTNNYLPASGGLDAETLEHAMHRVPTELRLGGRAVTRRDFEQLAVRADPRVARAYCTEPENGRDIRVLIVRKAEQPELAPIDKNELRARSELRKAVQADLDMRRTLTTRVEVASPRLFEVEVAVRMRIRPTFDTQKIEREALRRLYRFLSPLTGGSLSGEAGGGWEFGRSLYPSEVLVLLQSIQGVSLIEWLTFTPSIWEWQGTGQGWQLSGPKPAPTQATVALLPADMLISGIHLVQVQVDRP